MYDGERQAARHPQLAQNHRTLYVSGEESGQQIKLRASRLGVTEYFPENTNCSSYNHSSNIASSEELAAINLHQSGLYVLPETNLENILNEIESLQPNLTVIDSIQTIFLPNLTSAPGSVAQVRECTSALMKVAKHGNTTMFIVGHVTKEGAIAGPKVLEHLVDTVLYFEGDRFASHRLLRTVKNRFGATHEIGIFEMVENV